MTRARLLAIAIASALTALTTLTASTAAAASDLSTYRGFQLGMTLDAAAKQAGIMSEARIVHRRPALLQELTWEPARSLGAIRPDDSVRRVLLSFYNGELFRIVVSYDWDRTVGLTVDDMVEALSLNYGLAALPATETVSLSTDHSESDRVMAQWDDREHTISLFRPSYASTFGLTVASKRLEILARAAGVEAVRLDEQEAPERAIERKRKQDDENLARQEKARTGNRATFRP